MSSDRPRILIVDDDPLFRSLLTGILRDDYAVSTAKDGADGFYKALHDPPDVAVIDINLPEWDGLKTLSEIRNEHSLKDVKTIMLTSDASPETVTLAMHGGANDYMIKSTFSRTEFLDKLSRLLDHRRVVLAD